MKTDQYTRVITILEARGPFPPEKRQAELLGAELRVRDAAGYEHVVAASASYVDATPEEAARFWRQRCEALQADLDSIGRDQVDDAGAAEPGPEPVLTRREEARALHRAVSNVIAGARENEVLNPRISVSHSNGLAVFTTIGGIPLGSIPAGRYTLVPEV